MPRSQGNVSTFEIGSTTGPSLDPSVLWQARPICAAEVRFYARPIRAGSARGARCAMAHARFVFLSFFALGVEAIRVQSQRIDLDDSVDRKKLPKNVRSIG